MGSSKRFQYPPEVNFMADIGKALGHSARVCILRHLHKYQCARNNDLINATQLAEATVHRHLTVLQNTGLITEIWLGSHYYVLTKDAKEMVKNLDRIFSN